MSRLELYYWFYCLSHVGILQIHIKYSTVYVLVYKEHLVFLRSVHFSPGALSVLSLMSYITRAFFKPYPPKRQSFSFPPPPSNPHLYEYFVQCHDKFTFNWVNCTSSSMSGHRYSIKSVIANKLNKYCPRKKLHLQSQLLTGGGTLKMVLYKQ